MNTSNHRLRALFLCVLLILSGCGSGGGGGEEDPVLPYLLVLFFLGDPGVAYAESEVLFTVGGAPSDGSVQRIDDTEIVAKALLQGFELTLILAAHIAFFAFAGPPPELDVVYSLGDAVNRVSDSPAHLELNIDLFAPFEENAAGTVQGASDTFFDFGRTTNEVRGHLDSPVHFGLADTGLDLNALGCIEPDGTVKWDLRLDQASDSDMDLAAVDIYLGGTLLAGLGEFLAGTETTREVQLELEQADLAMPLELRFTATSESFFRSTRLELRQDLRLPPQPLQLRVYDLPFAPEGIDAIARSNYEIIRPGELPVDLNSYAFALAGAGGLLEGLALPDPGGITTLDSADPGLGAATYRSRILIPGVDPDPEEDLFWKPRVGGPAYDSHTVAAQILVGAWGISIANFDNADGDFEPHSVLEAGNMTDVYPFDGKASAARAVYVDNAADAIKFLGLNDQDEFVLEPGETLTNTAWAGASGRAVSACRHPSGDLLFCTDGAPGELWRFAPGDPSATKVADLYDAPRTVRTAGNIAAVGCFGSGGLSFGGIRLFVRSQAGAWNNAPFSRSAIRAVGIDMKELPDGRVAIASTSFFADQLSVMVLSGTTGEILDDQTIALPPGCTGPGHCAWVRDPGVDGVFVTCNTSNQLVLLPVDLTP